MSTTGIAEGASVVLADIIAINVRTEITFGLFSDGCTALSWRTDRASFLAQNWDWMDAQRENLIQLTIEQSGKPVIKMITEAGLIGKIGLNSAGVGVCLNAIKAKGMDSTRIPCHLGLRTRRSFVVPHACGRRRGWSRAGMELQRPAQD
jgi:isopenicillin-N N-acyltransferase-like protein